MQFDYPIIPSLIEYSTLITPIYPLRGIEMVSLHYQVAVAQYLPKII